MSIADHFPPREDGRAGDMAQDELDAWVTPLQARKPRQSIDWWKVTGIVVCLASAVIVIVGGYGIGSIAGWW